MTRVGTFITNASMPRVKRANEKPSPRRAKAAAEPTHRLGSHLSIAGGVHHAIEAARALGCQTVQIFVKNQRQWRAAPMDPAAVAAWKRCLGDDGFGPPVAHATYLINLAAADDALLAKSCEAFAQELQRCDVLGISGLVVHPGAAGAQPREAALARVAAALNTIFRSFPDIRCRPLLETTAGQGSTLGRTIDELAAIIELLNEPQRVGVCVDTCHVFAAGYDIRSPAGFRALIDEIDDRLGLDRVRCWHVNDSRGDLGSRVDRHAHIGEGCIGDAGFRNLMQDRRFRDVPMILETPKDDGPDGVPWDAINLERLRKLAAPGRASRSRAGR